MSLQQTFFTAAIFAGNGVNTGVSSDTNEGFIPFQSPAVGSLDRHLPHQMEQNLNSFY